MKKLLLLFFMLLPCLCFAYDFSNEEKIYCTGDVLFDTCRESSQADFYIMVHPEALELGKVYITAIVPYESGYLLKLSDTQPNYVYELYIEPGTVLYTKDYYWWYRNKVRGNTKLNPDSKPYVMVIKDVKPNMMTVKFELREE